MPDPLDDTAPVPVTRYTFLVRLRRALARRFPRTRVAYNFVVAKTRHYAWHAVHRIRLRRFKATWRWGIEQLAGARARRRDPRLTVGVEISPFWEPLTGVGWYLYRLLEHLADRDDVALRLYGPSMVDSPDLPPPHVAPPSGQALERRLMEIPDDLLLPRGLLIALCRRLEPLLLALEGNQVLFAPNYFLPRRFLLAPGARVVTVHDLGVRKVPETLRSETLEELTEKLEHSLFEAARVISVSGAVRDELDELGYAAPERVRAIHHGPGNLAGVEPGALPEAAPERFGLHVGTLEPRKNIVGLLAAWRALRRRLPEAPPLVLCGRFGWKTVGIRAAVEAAVDEGWLVHLGYVSDAELAALYRRAAVVVFPSLYEGFGLPAVEAQWAETPLVCSDIPVLREVAGDGALFAPADRPDLLAEAIATLLTDEAVRRRLVAAGRERARSLSWPRAADSTLAVWREAAGRPESARGASG